MTRLDAEELRDAILMVADELIEAGGGPSEPVQVRADGLVLTGRRRSIYVQQLRKHPPSLLESFDLPSMNPNCLQRTDSMVPTQALHLWNDATIRQSAGRFADHVLRGSDGSASARDESLIDQIYWIALGRPPRSDELSLCVESLTQLKQSWRKQVTATDDSAQSEAAKRALSIICHTILNSADFLYID